MNLIFEHPLFSFACLYVICYTIIHIVYAFCDKPSNTEINIKKK